MDPVVRKTYLEKIIKDFLKSVRGNHTQKEWGEIIDESYYNVNRWEKATKIFMWQDFVKLSKTLNLPLIKAFKDVLNLEITDISDEKIINQLLSNFSKELQDSKILSYQKINRIKNKTSKLSFKDFLIVISEFYKKVEGFLLYLLDPEKHSDFFEILKPRVDIIHEVAKDPTLALLLFIFEFQGYRSLPEHSHQFIEDLTGFTSEVISKKIKVLENIKAIKKENGKYEVKVIDLDFTITGEKNNILIFNYWSQIVNNYSQKNSENLSNVNKHFFKYLIYESDPEFEEKMLKLQKRFFIDCLKLLNDNYATEKSTLKLVKIESFALLDNWEVLNKS